MSVTPDTTAPAAGPPAVVLLSGGLDSTTVLAVARRDGFTPYAMTFRYGQRHAVEIEAARKVATAMGVADHVVVDIDLRAWGGSALTADVDVPKDRDVDAPGDEIPATYVPARNTIFPSQFALAWAGPAGGHRDLHRHQRAQLSSRLSGLPPGVHHRLRGHGPSSHPVPVSKAQAAPDDPGTDCST